MSLLSLGAVTVADYRVQTGDTTSAASAVSAALLEAEDLLGEELRRHLALESRTGAFPIYPDGRVYPDAYPVTVATLTISGRALLGAAPDGGPFIGAWATSVVPPRATLTWTGGFNAATLPATLRHALYDLGRGLLLAGTGDTTSAYPGAKSLSLGDASVTLDTAAGSSGVDTYVTGLAARVGRYRNRWV